MSFSKLHNNTPLVNVYINTPIRTQLYRHIHTESYILAGYCLNYRQKEREGMKYIHMRLEELLNEHKLSKKKVCSALDIERTNFNLY